MHQIFPIADDECKGGRFGETCNRKQGIDPEPINRLQLIASVQALVGAGFLPNVLANPCQIEQVVMNSAVNARDAMPDAGCLTIKTEAVQLEEAFVRAHREVKPGAYAQMSVSELVRE